ncbi:MAG: hypothetical protein JNK24_08535, partial [Alphaproteobacteria bacterium]|nr:hypothetical protein [Alphaproteobacteria bacterium]
GKFKKEKIPTTVAADSNGELLFLKAHILYSLIEEIVSLGRGAEVIDREKQARLQQEIDQLPAEHAEAFHRSFSGKLDAALLCSLGLTLPVITVPETSTASCPVVQMRYVI